jgi:hypothetical protein
MAIAIPEDINTHYLLRRLPFKIDHLTEGRWQVWTTGNIAVLAR